MPWSPGAQDSWRGHSAAPVPLGLGVRSEAELACERERLRRRLRAAAGVFAGVSMYTAHDINFTIVGYSWIAIWYTFAVFEMVYVKKVVDTVQMTTWSRTYYQVRNPKTLKTLHGGAQPTSVGRAWRLVCIAWLMLYCAGVVVGRAGLCSSCLGQCCMQ